MSRHEPMASCPVPKLGRCKFVR